MPVRVTTADAPHLLRYTFDSEWEACELAERRRELIRAGQLTADSAVLFDLRKSTAFPSVHDLNAAVMDGVWPACRAFVVASQSQYDLARRLQALLGPHTVISQIFDDEAEALEWLAAFTARRRSVSGASRPACQRVT
ncbi:MAG TPA: hypothetical protein VEA16_09565 [Vicinamibacterales bacterium]|nr:hypothetical protein [Vicinamibacterales bacterium]